MDEITQIKYNRTVGKLVKYLSTLRYVHYDGLCMEDYYDKDGCSIIGTVTVLKDLFVDKKLYDNDMNEELFFGVIKKFTKHEDYSIRWKN